MPKTRQQDKLIELLIKEDNYSCLLRMSRHQTEHGYAARVLPDNETLSVTSLFNNCSIRMFSFTELMASH